MKTPSWGDIKDWTECLSNSCYSSSTFREPQPLTVLQIRWNMGLLLLKTSEIPVVSLRSDPKFVSLANDLFPCNAGTKTWLILHFHWKRTRGNFVSSSQWDNWRQSWRMSFVQPQFHIRYLYTSLDAFFTYLTLHVVKHICAIYWFPYFVIWHKP